MQPDGSQSYPEPVLRLMAEFGKMPGVGPRTAERMTQYILRAGREEALLLARALRDVKDRVRPCPSCFNPTPMQHARQVSLLV